MQIKIKLEEGQERDVVVEYITEIHNKYNISFLTQPEVQNIIEMISKDQNIVKSILDDGIKSATVKDKIYDWLEWYLGYSNPDLWEFCKRVEKRHNLGKTEIFSEFKTYINEHYILGRKP